eukprot:403340996
MGNVYCCTTTDSNAHSINKNANKPVQKNGKNGSARDLQNESQNGLPNNTRDPLIDSYRGGGVSTNKNSFIDNNHYKDDGDNDSQLSASILYGNLHTPAQQTQKQQPPLKTFERQLSKGYTNRQANSSTQDLSNQQNSNQSNTLLTSQQDKIVKTQRSKPQQASNLSPYQAEDPGNIQIVDISSDFQEQQQKQQDHDNQGKTLIEVYQRSVTEVEKPSVQQQQPQGFNQKMRSSKHRVQHSMTYIDDKINQVQHDQIQHQQSFDANQMELYKEDEEFADEISQSDQFGRSMTEVMNNPNYPAKEIDNPLYRNSKTAFSNLISENDSFNAFDEDLSEIGANSSMQKSKKGKKKKKKKLAAEVDKNNTFENGMSQDNSQNNSNQLSQNRPKTRKIKVIAL